MSATPQETPHCSKNDYNRPQNRLIHLDVVYDDS